MPSWRGRWRCSLGVFLPVAAACAGFYLADLTAWPFVAAVPLIAGLSAWCCASPRSPETGEASPVPPSQQPALLPQDVLERLPDPVILLNGGREIIAINRPARDVLGVGTLGRDLALSMRHPDVLAAVDTLLAGVPTIREEITLPVPVPQTFTLHGGSLPANGDAGKARVVLVLHDETRARRAEKSRVDFVANASHELRSPLSALIGLIETLRTSAANDESARERFLGIMQTEARRMARLVEDLMSLSRVEINEHVPPRGIVDLAELLDTLKEALIVRAEHKGMTIEVDCSADLSPVMGDWDQLMQVFHNLVDNAIKYGRSDTRVQLVARSLERIPGSGVPGVTVAVMDQGPGIATLHLPRLTERFYRADEGRSRRLGGTGLGLAIVKHIVNRHRGRLTIESQEGVGSSFTVFLPVTVAETPKPAGTDADRRQAAATVIKP